MGIFQQFPYSNFHEFNLDQIIKIMREMQDEWEDTKTEWASYKDFIDNYFENLDVSEEVLEALRTLASTGELNDIIDPVISADVTQWLLDNISPTTPAIDESLTVLAAGADSKSTGDIALISARRKGALMTATFTSAGQNVDIGYHLFANVTYYITCNTAGVTTNVLVSVKENPGQYVPVGSSTGTVKFTPTQTGTLRMYNQAGGFIGTVDMLVEPAIVHDPLAGYGSITTNTQLDEVTNNTRSANNFKANSVLVIAANTVALTDGVNTNGSLVGTYETYSPANAENADGNLQVFTTLHNVRWYRIKMSGAWTNWSTANTAQMEFTANAQNITLASNQLKAYHKYMIRINATYTGVINVYAVGETSRFISIPANTWMEYTPEVTGYLRMFNGTADNYQGLLHVEIVDTNERIYSVGTGHEYTSLTQLLIDLKDDKSEKIIYVYSGTYDIYQEYVDAGVTFPPDSENVNNYFNYCVFLPVNTKLIGKGDVTLSWQPTTGDISAKASQMLSPLNVAGGCYVENISIVCKNGRYCIHDDPQTRTEYYGMKHIYKNVKCTSKVHDTSYGMNYVIGFGFTDESEYIFENCVFVNEADGTAFYGHNSQTSGILNANSGASVTCKGCAFSTISTTRFALLQNLSTTKQRLKTLFESCYLPLPINVTEVSGAAQSFDITIIKSDNINVNMPADNTYPVVKYL